MTWAPTRAASASSPEAASLWAVSSFQPSNLQDAPPSAETGTQPNVVSSAATVDLLAQKQTTGDALAVSSEWTTPPAAEEPAQPSPWTTAGTEKEEQVQFVEEFVEKTLVVVEEVAAPCGSGGGRAGGAATTRRQFRTAASSATPTSKEDAHQAPSRSWPSKLSAFSRSVSSTSNVSAPRDVAGMTRNDKA
ncbi:hypothetical protein PF005_g14251 [Phytophthora fragariae]|uniref:Uncharacterized protein n=1 Tax=Phytophthora fragariae TaxID=53985 RepID=A0A6A3EX65_9STRA|nr:hypothetical protein PF003_g3933 [Phytophthora fragariae]KAE8934598.1 hypothetical protein PF009_g15426 [Phytophthora fragariae]KAE9018852.1 hypothetical protein PF011_g6082 [Phytophthora fragariae]KAE9102912.1 hypothetical protein PF010_g13943 [Phytophthora fragariae]KAE9103081.1 hypothetical protein PF007_g14527 [Phytophthora fragariae]